MKESETNQCAIGENMEIFFPRRHVEVFRPPLPIAQIYPPDILRPGRKVKASATEANGDMRKSLFFNRRKLDIEQDPFLRRLSRLS